MCGGLKLDDMVVEDNVTSTPPLTSRACDE